MTAFAEGAPCWADVMLPDLEAGKRFYGELFDWTFSEGGAEFGHYTLALKDANPAAGLMRKSDGRMPTAWGLFLATGDIGRCARKIRAAGGRVVTEPMAVGDLGSLLVATDVGGAVFGAWQGGDHVGFGVRGVPGAYGWMDIATRDPEGVDAFYEEVFGLEGVTAGPMASETYLPLRPAGSSQEVGGRSVIGADAPAELPAHLTAFFVVEDMDAALRTVSRLGGRLAEGPNPSPGGPYAMCVDDQGAIFGVMATK